MFGAALVPLSQAVMYDIYPPERRGSALSLWTMGVMVGPILGPILGGWLTENYNWRWVFYINVPFGLLAAIGVLTLLRETPYSSAAKLDWIGFAGLRVWTHKPVEATLSDVIHDPGLRERDDERWLLAERCAVGAASASAAEQV